MNKALIAFLLCMLAMPAAAQRRFGGGFGGFHHGPVVGGFGFHRANPSFVFPGGFRHFGGPFFFPHRRIGVFGGFGYGRVWGGFGYAPAYPLYAEPYAY